MEQDILSRIFLGLELIIRTKILAGDEEYG